MTLATERPVVFAAFSKHNFFWRDHIIQFVLEQGAVPIAAFVMFDYFLADRLPRTMLIAANNDLLRRSDELWVLGQISNGVQAEIELATSLDKPIRCFQIDDHQEEFGMKEIDGRASRQTV